MTEHQGIKIDYCPQCRGVWLDRGELDKTIERSASSLPQQPALFIPPQHQPSAPPSYPQQTYDPRYYPRHQKHHKCKSFLGELFDFD